MHKKVLKGASSDWADVTYSTGSYQNLTNSGVLITQKKIEQLRESSIEI